MLRQDAPAARARVRVLRTDGGECSSVRVRSRQRALHGAFHLRKVYSQNGNSFEARSLDNVC